MVVNKQPAEDYFARDVLMMVLRQPFEVTETEGQFDIHCNVEGGGKSGQAGAVRLGIARALLLVDPTLRPVLKSGGFLTRGCTSQREKEVRSAWRSCPLPVLQALKSILSGSSLIVASLRGSLYA